MKTPKFNHEGDNLIYVVSTLRGGEDGLDSSNHGGPVKAFRTMEGAKDWAGADSRYKINPKVLNAQTMRIRLRNRLTVEEKAYLEVLGVDLEMRDGRAR